MSRSVRASFALGVLLAAFGALLGCGQRGPLTLPTAARPVERNAPPATGAENPGAQSPAAPTDGAPRPEDEERRKNE